MTKIKAAVKLCRNRAPATGMAREFEERAEKLGHRSLVKEAARYAEEMDIQLQLEYPNPTCIKHDSEEVITAEKFEGRAEKGFGTENMGSGSRTELAGETKLYEMGRYKPRQAR